MNGFNRRDVLKQAGGAGLGLTLSGGLITHAAHAAAPPARTLIRGGFLYAADEANTVIPESWVLVEGQRIAAIGDSSSAPPTADHVIDARGKMVVPGFVNPHWHESFAEGPDRFAPDDSDLISTDFSGGADIEALGEYFDSLVDVGDRLTDEEALAIARYSLWTQLRGGTTLIGDTGSLNRADAMAQAAIDLGMRIAVGRWTSDGIIPNEGTDFRYTRDWRDQLADWRMLIARWKGHPSGLVRPFPSVLAAFTSSDEQLAALKRIVDEHDLPYAAHLGAVEEEATANRRVFGRGSIARMDEAGLLTDRLLGIHTNRIGEQEYRRLVEVGANICYSPANYGLLGENSISGTGIAARFLRDGVPVSTSTDGNVSFASGMPEAMRALYLMINESEGDNTACTPTTALAAGTRHGAIGMGWERETGSIAVGKQADLVLIGIDDWRYRLVAHPWSVYLVAGSGDDVDTVMVAGEIVVRNGRGTRIDEDVLFADYARSVRSANRRIFGSEAAPIR